MLFYCHTVFITVEMYHFLNFVAKKIAGFGGEAPNWPEWIVPKKGGGSTVWFSYIFVFFLPYPICLLRLLFLLRRLLRRLLQQLLLFRLPVRFCSLVRRRSGCCWLWASPRGAAPSHPARVAREWRRWKLPFVLLETFVRPGHHWHTAVRQYHLNLYFMIGKH